MSNKIINTPEFHFFVYSLLLLPICNSCSDAPRQQIIPIQPKKENKTGVASKPPASFFDTLNIDFPAAVFYSPDSLQLEKIKSVTDSGIFDGSMHEYYYLIRNARIVIKKNIPQLKIIEAKNVKYLLFIRADKTIDYIDLDTKKDAYGLFVFDRLQPPRLLDMANIDTELGFYFSK